MDRFNPERLTAQANVAMVVQPDGKYVRFDDAIAYIHERHFDLIKANVDVANMNLDLRDQLEAAQREHALHLLADDTQYMEWSREREALRVLLREAAETFRRYEALHRAKGTPESTEKAEVNADIAARLEAALGKEP